MSAFHGVSVLDLGRMDRHTALHFPNSRLWSRFIDFLAARLSSVLRLLACWEALTAHASFARSLALVGISSTRGLAGSLKFSAWMTVSPSAKDSSPFSALWL